MARSPRRRTAFTTEEARRGPLRRRAMLAGSLSVAVAIGAGVPVGSAAPRADGAPERSSPRWVDDELIVRFREGAGAAERAATRRSVGAREAKPLGLPGLELLSLPPGSAELAAATALERRPDVRYAEPNFIRGFEALPSDPSFGELWGLHNTGQTVDGHVGTPDADIDAPEAWDASTGNAGVLVAVVDTGVAYDHPDLAPNMWTNPGETGGGKQTNGVDDDANGYVDDWHGWDWWDDDNDPKDYLGHGTHVAGTVGAAGNDGNGIAGVNWDVSLMPLRTGDAYSDDAGLIQAFLYAGDMGADVVQASIRGDEFSQAVSDAVEFAPDVLFAVAAGNEGWNNDLMPGYPCNLPFDNVICVAATDNTDTIADFSSYGPTSVDLAAPGVGILSALPNFETPIKEQFEVPLSNGWVLGGVQNTWGRVGPVDDFFGIIASDSPRNYKNNANAWMRTANPVSTQGLEHCRLRYWVYHTFATGDRLYAEASTDNSTWATVGTWSGSSQGFWLFSNDRMSEFDDEPQVWIRFRLVTNANGAADGSYLEDVRLRCFPSSGAYQSDDYWFNDGTSMATPHVAGVAALLLSEFPAADVADLRTAILAGTEARSTLQTKLVTGGRLNAANSMEVLGNPAAATVVASDTAFSPQKANVAQGKAVLWTFTGPGFHTATDSLGLGDGGVPLFDSGERGAGAPFYARFDAAGTYPYASVGDPGTFAGKVTVPAKAAPASGGEATVFTITSAAGTMPGFRFVVHVRFRPEGSGTFGPWSSLGPSTSPARSFVSDQGAGTYQFRSRLANIGSGAFSGWSPRRSITVA